MGSFGAGINGNFETIPRDGCIFDAPAFGVSRTQAFRPYKVDAPASPTSNGPNITYICYHPGDARDVTTIIKIHEEVDGDRKITSQHMAVAKWEDRTEETVEWIPVNGYNRHVKGKYAST